MIYPKEKPEFLNLLCKMCHLQRNLPRSMVIDAVTGLQNVPDIPDYGGGFADVYRGECDGHAVAIKVIRFYASTDAGLFLSVGAPFRTSHENQLIPSLSEVLSRSCRMEAPPTPKYSAFARRDVGCDGAASVCVGVRMDKQRQPRRLHPRARRSESCPAGELPCPLSSPAKTDIARSRSWWMPRTGWSTFTASTSSTRT